MNERFQRKVETLEKLGIEVPDAARASWKSMAGSIRESGFDPCQFPFILQLLGVGELDEDAMACVPFGDDVIYADFEMTYVFDDYRFLLERVAAVSKGEVTISDVQFSEMTDEQMEAGTGEVTISYVLNGEPCSYQAVFDYDWMDVGFLNDLSDRIEALCQKRLWWIVEDDVGVTGFLADAEWAQRFTAATGVPLVDKV